MSSPKPTSTARSIGVTFDESMINLLDALREEAGPEEDGSTMSRSELIRRLVFMGIDLLQRNHPVLAQYRDPEKVAAEKAAKR
ncbi:hypothetical protein [Methylobacterium symbioticum]|nr:hypothetical protein [Methylobacterium symbioticum]